MRLFTLFTYLKTKESYDRWITRRVWGFKQQISKAKYLKMSVENIRKLKRTLQLCMSDRVGTTRGSRHVYQEKLKRPPFPSDCEISGCKMSAHGIPDVKCRRTEFLPGWTELCCARGTVCVCKVQGPLSRMTRSAQGYPDQIHPDFPIGHAPPCYPALVNITLRMIAYPIQICCPNH